LPFIFDELLTVISLPSTHNLDADLTRVALGFQLILRLSSND
jgi:hypothetical protein